MATVYERVSVQEKQQILSSIFPQKLVFENRKYRTPFVNPTVTHICLNINELFLEKDVKKGHLIEVSSSVFPRGLEPPS